MAKISVVVTLYNLEKYIDDALKSVFSQTRLPDEVIVADDCSNDRSGDIVATYGDKVKYIRQTHNIGALQNSLNGLKEVTGEIVSFLDGDDVWMLDKLERIEKLFLSDPSIVLVSHDLIRVDEDLNTLSVVDETMLNTRSIIRRYTEDQRSEKFRQAILLRGGFWLGSAYSIRKSCFDVFKFEAILNQLGGYKLSYLDMTLGPYIVATNPNGKVGFINGPLFKYRVHGANSWNSSQLSRAIANVKRWREVNQSTWDILNYVSDDPIIKKRYLFLNRESHLHQAELENKRFEAVKRFLVIAPAFFVERRFLREFQKLMIIALVGPNILLKLRTLKNK